MKRIIMATILAFFMSSAHSATEWCVNDTMKCAHGTPPLSKLKLADRQAALYKLTVADRNAAVAEGLYIPVTVNELIVLAKEYLKPVIPPVEPEPPVIPPTEPPVVEPPVTPPTYTWSKCADLWGWCGVPNNSVVRYGQAGDWTEIMWSESNTCNPNNFNAREWKAGDYCEVRSIGQSPTDPPIEPEPPVIPPVEPPPTEPPHNHGNMPHVDESKNMAKAEGFNTLRVRPTSRTTATSGTGGDFRINCAPSHMGVFDPVVYPGQAGVPHHHTFFGNVTTNKDSTTGTLLASGNSTCLGGIANRSAYWIPSLIDTTNNAPLKPNFALFYYKNGNIKPPTGLVILAGDMSGSPTNQQATGWSPEVIRWICNDVYAGKQNHIPACSGKLSAMIQFPMWWDGRLDSPDHKAHMSYEQTATHNKRIPDITFTVSWNVSSTNNLRLSSDNYVGGAGGYSLHADYMFAWDDAVLTKWFNGCTLARRDCHSELLGNGEELY
jgi:hypothetical protein